MKLASEGRENNTGISEIREEVREDVNVVNFSEEVISNREDEISEKIVKVGKVRDDKTCVQLAITILGLYGSVMRLEM